jgi:hypothetical protein
MVVVSVKNYIRITMIMIMIMIMMMMMIMIMIMISTDYMATVRSTLIGNLLRFLFTHQKVCRHMMQFR